MLGYDVPLVLTTQRCDKGKYYCQATYNRFQPEWFSVRPKISTGARTFSLRFAVWSDPSRQPDCTVATFLVQHMSVAGEGPRE